jgi:hypothetical protein
MFLDWTLCSPGQYCLYIGRCTAQGSVRYILDGVEQRAVLFIDGTVCSTRQNWFEFVRFAAGCSIDYSLDGVHTGHY